jgi:hypothetical protein
MLRSWKRGQSLFRPGLGMSPIVLALALVAAATAAENLPVTAAETLSGHKLEFPTALAGKPAVCVFGFSKEAGDLSKVWMTRLYQDGISAWSVANLEKAPAFVRGMIRGSMRKGTPAPQLDRSLILTKDQKAWEKAVGSQQESQPVVVVMDPAGRILWTFQGPFAEEPYQRLKAKLEAAR